MFSAEGIVISNIVDLNDLTTNNTYIINNSNCVNYPPNNFKLGKLLVQKSIYGIRQVFFNDDSNITYTRNCYADINNWSDWKQIYPDYLSRLFDFNGYIIFTNGLIIQWGDISWLITNYTTDYGHAYYHTPTPINTNIFYHKAVYGSCYSFDAGSTSIDKYTLMYKNTTSIVKINNISYWEYVLFDSNPTGNLNIKCNFIGLFIE